MFRSAGHSADTLLKWRERPDTLAGRGTNVAIDMDREAEALTRILAQRKLAVFRVTKRGKALTIVSGREDEPDPHARLTNTTPTRWRLDVLNHMDRWEKTPFEGSLAELVESLLSIGRLDPRDA